MIGKYEAQLVYDSLPAGYIADVPGYVFSYLYTNYPFVDSLMTADTYATNVAGNTSSDAYYQALWNKTGGFTKQLMQHASSALASLIYSAWVQAGSPRMYPNGIHDRKQPGSPYMMAAFPDPAVVKLNIPVVIPSGRTQVRLLIYNTMGALVRTVIDEVLPEGCHTIECPVDGFASGLYFCRLTSGTSSVTRRFIVAR
jgi:hypothetical protein